MSKAKPKKITAEQKEARRKRARIRAEASRQAKLEAECATRLEHYPAEDRTLLLALFEVTPQLAGMDLAIAVLIRRNFTRCEPKIGWQDAARMLLAHAGQVQP